MEDRAEADDGEINRYEVKNGNRLEARVGSGEKKWNRIKGRPKNERLDPRK